jgi:hypothetical protein
LRLDCRDAPLGEVGEFKVVKEKVEEFVAGQSEAEIVLTLPIVATGRAAAPAAGGSVDRVAFDEALVAGQDMIMHPAFPRASEAGLANTIGWDRDFPSPLEIGDVPISCGLAHGPLNLRLGAAKEALAVRQTLAPWVEAPVDDVHRNA